MIRDLLASLPPALLPMLLAAADPASAAAGEGQKVKAVKDVAYYEGEGAHDVKHKLDLYLPEGQSDFPVLLFVHGGAWVHGDKSFLGVYEALARSFVREGIGVAVTNYRLSPAVRHPEHVKDVARAFAWVHRNIASHGGRPDQVFVCGHSAGGHLVSLLATDESYLKEHGLSTKNISGVIALSGVYIIPDGYLSHVFSKEQKKASPISHARAGLPPFLILYADRDMPGCDRTPAEMFRQALVARGSQAETLEVKDSDHLRIILAAGTPENVAHKAIVNFLHTQIAR